MGGGNAYKTNLSDVKNRPRVPPRALVPERVERMETILLTNVMILSYPQYLACC